MGGIVIAAVLLTMAATAQATASSTASAAAEATAPRSEAPARTTDSDKPKRVCRARAATGSIMRGRVCRTTSEDEQPAETTRDRQAHNDEPAEASQTRAQ